jgi:NAD(P)H-hydrate epimerase
MGQAPETVEFLGGLLAEANVPTVVDADGLNILAAHPELLAQYREKTLVLTPHPGEMARLVGKTVAEVQAARLETARALAQKTGAMVVLKGARTIVAHPDGTAAVNTTGNPAMAKGGSGDLLCGMIAGLLAQFPTDAARAVEAAVYLHGLAADLAVAHGEEHAFLPTDLLQWMGRAFQFHPAVPFRGTGPNGYVCLQGSCARQSLQARCSQRVDR